MKPNHPDESDQPLSELLREWKVDASLPRGFRERVWRRIEQPASSAHFGQALRRWLEMALPRPALALSYLAVLLAIGASAGWTQARSETRRVDDALGLRYVQSIDPYRAVAPAGNP